MKKFFALVLAVAMVLSMASVAMAADSIAMIGDEAFDYNADTDTMTAANGFEKVGDKWVGALLTYGDTVYYPIYIGTEAAGVSFVEDYSLVEKLKVKAEFEMGEDLVESVNVVKKYVKKLGAGNVNDYIYFVAFKTKSAATTADADVVGTLTFDRKELKGEDAVGFDAKLVGEIDDVECDFAFNLFYETSWIAGSKGATISNGTAVALKWDTDYALKFDYDDEAEFNFGFNQLNEGSFIVDVSGQGKVYVRYNTKAVDAIVDANPGVKMHFINFNDVKFNRTGEFTYELEDGVAAYKVVDGALVEIAGLEVDDGEFKFNTRTLGSYVFADAELVNPVVAAPVAPEAVTNPTTGA